MFNIYLSIYVLKMSLKNDLEKIKEKIKSEWVWYHRLKEWDCVIRTFKETDGTVNRVVSWILDEIIINFNWNDRQFVKQIKVNWKIYSVKKFKKFYYIVKKNNI